MKERGGALCSKQLCNRQFFYININLLCLFLCSLFCHNSLHCDMWMHRISRVTKMFHYAIVDMVKYFFEELFEHEKGACEICF